MRSHPTPALALLLGWLSVLLPVRGERQHDIQVGTRRPTIYLDEQTPRSALLHLPDVLFRSDVLMTPIFLVQAWLNDPALGHSASGPVDSKMTDHTLEARLRDVEASLPSTRPRLIQWSEDLVEDNGGTILAVAGRDYCILAADTRLSSDYQIRSRNVTRIMKVSVCSGRSTWLCIEMIH
jgi:hypothetical protein